MPNIKKWFAWALVLLMALQAPGMLASAEAPVFTAAIAEGRELSYTAGVVWYGMPGLDEETNGIMTSIFDATAISGRMAQTENGYYEHCDLLLNGESTMAMDMVVREDGVYYNSPFFGPPWALKTEDIAEFYAVYGAYFDTMMEESGNSTEGMFGMLLENYGVLCESMATGESVEMMFDPESLVPESVIDEMNVEAFVAIWQEWCDSALAGEPYEGEIGSVFGVEANKANLYELTKDELMALIEELMPLLKENDTLWNFVLDTAQSSLPADEQMDETMKVETLADIKALLDELIVMADASIPDDMIALYIECVDDAGNNILNELQFMLPANEEEGSEAFTAYVEWVPETLMFAAYLGGDSEGLQFILQETPEEATELGGAPASKKGFTATLSMLSGETSLGQIELNCTKIKSELAKEASLSIGYTDGDYTAGVVYDLRQATAQDGIDATMECDLDISFYENEAITKMLTANVTAKTGEPQGMPFDPDAMATEFVMPGKMNEDEFAAWIQEDVTVGVLQTALHIASELPPDVFAKLMQMMSTTAEY